MKFITSWKKLTGLVAFCTALYFSLQITCSSVEIYLSSKFASKKGLIELKEYQADISKQIIENTQRLGVNQYKLKTLQANHKNNKHQIKFIRRAVINSHPNNKIWLVDTEETKDSKESKEELKEKIKKLKQKIKTHEEKSGGFDIWPF